MQVAEFLLLDYAHPPVIPFEVIQQALLDRLVAHGTHGATIRFGLRIGRG